MPCSKCCHLVSRPLPSAAANAISGLWWRHLRPAAALLSQVGADRVFILFPLLPALSEEGGGGGILLCSGPFPIAAPDRAKVSPPVPSRSVGRGRASVACRVAAAAAAYTAPLVGPARVGTSRPLCQYDSARGASTTLHAVEVRLGLWPCADGGASPAPATGCRALPPTRACGSRPPPAPS